MLLEFYPHLFQVTPALCWVKLAQFRRLYHLFSTFSHECDADYTDVNVVLVQALCVLLSDPEANT